MKNLLYSVFVSMVMVVTIPGSIISATYYICDCETNADPDCVPGDDANPGTSVEQPWKTYDKAQGSFALLEAGAARNGLNLETAFFSPQAAHFT